MAQGPVCRTRRVDREATRWALRVIGANASWFEAEVYGITTDVKYDLTPYRVPDGELRIELPLQRAVINMAGRVALTSGTYTFFLPPRQEE